MSSILSKKALWLSYFTVGYNILEGVVSVFAGSLAGSVALVSFGIDSFIESISGSVMIWRFRKHDVLTDEQTEAIEKRAIKLIGYSFIILGVYVLYEAGTKLYFQEKPETTLLGIIIAILSIIIMPFLSFLKHQTGKRLQSRSLVADSKQTMICTIMSIALLIGLGLNYLYGIWWADPAAGLVICLFLFKEGYSALREEELCSC
ncbi:MAG: cation transporter [Candidatus Gracilibacteria bacterium]